MAREEFETARQAMQDWEVLAMEERSIREGLGDRVAELEEQLAGQQQAYERAAMERDDQSSTVDGLQRALQDIQEGMLGLGIIFGNCLTNNVHSTKARATRNSRKLPNPARRCPQTAQSRRRSLHRIPIRTRQSKTKPRSSTSVRKRSKREEPPNRQTPPRSRHTQ